MRPGWSQRLERTESTAASCGHTVGSPNLGGGVGRGEKEGEEEGRKRHLWDQPFCPLERGFPLFGGLNVLVVIIIH